MSQSAAQKRRKRQLREGKLDPAINRLHWNGTNPVSKMTPSLQETVTRQAKKHKTRNLSRLQGDDSFFHVSVRSDIPCSAA